jgi:hypothetical protein
VGGQFLQRPNLTVGNRIPESPSRIAAWWGQFWRNSTPSRIPPEEVQKFFDGLSQKNNLCVLTGLCLSPVDLAISKLAAGRKKDLSLVTAMLRHGLVDAEHIQSVIGELTEARLQHLRPRLARCQAEILR